MERDEIIQLISTPVQIINLQTKADLILQYCIQKGKSVEDSKQMIQMVAQNPFYLFNGLTLLDRMFLHVLEEKKVEHEITVLINLINNTIIKAF